MMNSKEALERLKSMPNCSECENYGKCFEKPLCNELYNIISIDLDRLEQLEKCNQVLMNKTLEISNKLTMYKKALEKACEKLDYTCPLEEELVDDLDCGNCENNCKECWVKFFLKEVVDNEY